MLYRIRHILAIISAYGFSRKNISKASFEEDVTFEEFLALVILMTYYSHTNEHIKLVIVGFYNQHTRQIEAMFPNETPARQLWLIESTALTLSLSLANDTEIERVTKTALRVLSH